MLLLRNLWQRIKRSREVIHKMKLTKNQLRRIIHEEAGVPKPSASSQKKGKFVKLLLKIAPHPSLDNDIDADEKDVERAWKQAGLGSKVTEEFWSALGLGPTADMDDIKVTIDDVKEALTSGVTNEGYRRKNKNIRITRNQLKRIIREELHRSLNEADEPESLFNVVKEFLIKAKGGWSPTYWKTLVDLLGTDGLAEAYQSGGTKAAIQLINARYDEIAGT